MNRKKLLLSALVVVGLSITGCAATVVASAAGAGVAAGTDSRGFGGVIGDQTLEHNVNTVLAKQAPKGSYTVASFKQHVLLAGQVPSEEYRGKAELAVRNTEGVRQVWNYLTVGKNESFDDITQDTYLTSAAKTRLIGQKNVNSNNIKVVTCNKVVYLLGKNAGDPVQIRGAIAGIKQLSGVKGVVDLINN